MKNKSVYIFLRKKSINNLLPYGSGDENKTFDVGERENN